MGDYNITNDGVDCVSDRCADPHVDVDVEQIIVHENYVTRRVSQYNDIALIRLMAVIDLTPFIRPISLPYAEIESVLLYQRKTAVSVGWGRTKTGRLLNLVESFSVFDCYHSIFPLQDLPVP